MGPEVRLDQENDAAARPADRARSLVDGYAPGEDRPLAGYAVLMGLYGVAVTAGAVALRRRGRPLPPVSLADIALVGVATHKVARRVSKDSVTSPLRAPFTRYEGVAGPAELQEGVRGRGLRKAVGELLSCPFCLSQWVSTGFTFGLVAAPRATRWTASVFASLALADFLQFAYAWAEQQAES
jgi:hypothetical protein